MTENIKARYIDPMLDWSFKRLFGTEVNKDGREFLVEMQRGAQSHFFERALFYTSFPIMKQGRKSLAEEDKDEYVRKKSWNFRLDGVFFLGVLNFSYEDDELIEHRYRLREATTGKVMTDRLEFVFVEVAKFDKGEDELETDLDRWLYMLKNLSLLLERPAALRDRIFGRIFDVAEFAGLDDDDKKNYVNAMNTERDTYNQIEYAREKGIEKGAEEKEMSIIQNLLTMGMSVQTICEATGTSMEKITKLAKDKNINAMNTERATYNQIEYAREQGMERGKAEGLAEARKEKLAIAMNFLRMGIPCEKVAEAMGLSETEVAQLKS